MTSSQNGVEKKHYSREEIATHNTEQDCWIIIEVAGECGVYNVTEYVPGHPGGAELMLGLAGKDGTVDFESTGHSLYAIQLLDDYHIGTTDAAPQVAKPATANKTDANSNTSIWRFMCFASGGPSKREVIPAPAAK